MQIKSVSEILEERLGLNEAKMPDQGETFKAKESFKGIRKGTTMEVQMVDNQQVTVKVGKEEKTFSSAEWKSLPIELV